MERRLGEKDKAIETLLGKLEKKMKEDKLKGKGE